TLALGSLGQMDDKILEFTALLRQNGLRVSMAEHMDTFQALKLIGIADRRVFKDTVRATMIKRSVDIAPYDELFDLYFTGLGEIIKSSTAATQGAMGLTDAQLQALMERMSELLQELGVELSELAQALLANDSGRLEKMLREAAEQARIGQIERSFQEGRYAHSLAQQLGLGELTQELEALRQRLAAAGLDPELAEQLQGFLDRRLQDLAEILKRAVRAELSKRDQSLRDNERMRSLAEKSFYYLSEDEIRRMKEAVAK